MRGGAIESVENVETKRVLKVKFFIMSKTFNKKLSQNTKRRFDHTAHLQTQPIQDIGFEMVSKYKVILIYIFLIGATLAVYWRVLYSDFTNFDDTIYVTENRYVNTGFTKENIQWAFTVGKVAYWHPLTWLSHILDCQLYGLRPGLHHLTSLIIHIANSMLLFAVFKRMTGAVWRSAFVAALFAVHPINVDSVAWIAERKSVLSTLFWLSTMWAYAGYTQRSGVWRYLLTIFLFAMGLLAKPMLVTLPFVMFILDYWPLGRLRFGRPSEERGRETVPVSHLVWEKIPFFVLSAVSVYLSYLSAQRLGITISTEFVPIKLRIANALVSYLSYIGKIIWPRKLAVFYPYPGQVTNWQSIGALVILVCITIVALLPVRRKPYLGVGWLWYVGTLLPVIGLVQAGLWPAMADRWAYVPLIGIAIITVWGVGDIAEKGRLRRAMMVFSAGACLLALMASTWLQVGHWRNSRTLFTRALDVTSDNYIAHLNLGNVFLQEKKVDEAIQHYLQSIENHRDYDDAHYNLGIAFGLQGKSDEAIEEYKIVLGLKEDYWKARFRLADALAKAGRFDEAISHYEKVVGLHPDDTEVYNNFALALVKKGRTSEAIEYYNKALAINPDSVEVLTNLGNAFLERREFEKAITQFKKALSLNPNFAEGCYNLANALRQMGQFGEAEAYYQKSLQLNPDNIDAYYGLGVVFAEQKKYDEAIVHLNKAIQLKPDFAQAYYNLGIIFAERNEVGKAIEQFRQVLRIHPDDAEMHCNLGVLLVRDGRIDEAISELQRAVQLDPNLTRAREQLEAAIAKRAVSTPK